MVWEESKNYEKERGFSLERQELRFEWTRDSGGCSTRLHVLESLQRVTKSSRTKLSTRAQESTKENRISTKQGTRCMKLKRIQKPRGHKEERASFPDQFHTRVSKIHSPKILILEKKEGTGRRRRRRLGEGRLHVWVPGQEQGRESG